jgi:glycosyltransferase involved in cell wall biosynthesis
MKISVAICCLNSEAVLPGTLTTLRANTPKDIEIMVIDDGSTDNTAKIAAVHGALVISHDKNFGYAQARQSALENCNSEILAFIDDSCLVSDDWFTRLEKIWSVAPCSTKIIAGLMEIYQPQSYLQKFQSRHNPFLPLPESFSRSNSLSSKILAYLKGKRLIKAAPIASFSNGNVSLRAAAIREIGGYDLRYSIGAEDEDLASRTISHFGKSAIYFDPSVVVTHVSDASFKSFIKRAYKYGRSAALRYGFEGGLPTIMPIPLVVLAVFAFGLAFQNYLVILFSLLAIPLSYSARASSAKYLILDGYLLFLAEIAHLSGFATFMCLQKKIALLEMSSL